MSEQNIPESNMPQTEALVAAINADELNDVPASGRFLGEDTTPRKPFDKKGLFIPLIVAAVVAAVITGIGLGAPVVVGVFAAAMPALSASVVGMSVAAQTAILASIGFGVAGLLSLAALGTAELYRSNKNLGFLTAPAWLTALGFGLVGLPMLGLLPAFGVGSAMASVAAALTGVTVTTAGAPLIGMAIVAGVTWALSIALYLRAKSRSGSKAVQQSGNHGDGKRQDVPQDQVSAPENDDSRRASLLDNSTQEVRKLPKKLLDDIVGRRRSGSKAVQKLGVSGDGKRQDVEQQHDISEPESADLLKTSRFKAAKQQLQASGWKFKEPKNPSNFLADRGSGSSDQAAYANLPSGSKDAANTASEEFFASNQKGGVTSGTNEEAGDAVIPDGNTEEQLFYIT